MAVKIRLMRIGAKKRPFYRVVAVDERKKRTGQYLELLGTYNPLTEPKEILLKQDRIDAWIKQGAQLSTGFLRIIGKAPQRPPRKPKKQKVEQPTPAEVKKEEAPQVVEEINAAEGVMTDEDSRLSESGNTELAGDAEEGSRASTAASSEDAPETPERQDPQESEDEPGSKQGAEEK